MCDKLNTMSTIPKRVLFILGTRPEAIKLAPLINQVNDMSEYEAVVCLTGQHRELLHQVLSFFKIEARFNLDVMKQAQDLFSLTTEILPKLKTIINQESPDMIVVQGDTTTAMLGALAGYYSQIKVAHIEAGLRSHKKYSPFPEEMNRRVISGLADYHFAPTHSAVQNLREEGVTKNVWMVGNTVVDALHLGMELMSQDELYYRDYFINQGINDEKKILLLTFHRRESFGKPLEKVLEAIKSISLLFPDLQIVFPVHPNPKIQEFATTHLSNIKNIYLMSPLSYPYFIWLLKNSQLILTDSGGVQEEAPSIGKPVLVLRDVTERHEAVASGTATLLGTNTEEIVSAVSDILLSPPKASSGANPFGDGCTSERIIQVFKSILEPLEIVVSKETM